MRNLFVIMPFGQKAVATRMVDFDAVYEGMIRPAAVEAGWTVLRIDEIVAAGSITEQYLQQILSADLVLAEISSPNANVFYELGIRHAISPRGALLIAEQGSTIPFDLSGQRVLLYENTPAGLQSGQAQLRQALAYHVDSPFDNPTWRFLQSVSLLPNPATDPIAFERDLEGRIDRAGSRDALRAVWELIGSMSYLPVRSLSRLAELLSSAGDWLTAAAVLRRSAEFAPNDFRIQRQLGWYLSQLGNPYDEAAVAALERAFALNPSDSETCGMLGGRAKRLGDFESARRWYRKGADMAPDNPYVLINLAALDIIVSPQSPERGEAAYQRIIELLQTASTAPDEWHELNLGEAFFVIGDDVRATEHYKLALGLASSPKSLASAAAQLRLFARRGFRSTAAGGFIDLLSQDVARLRISSRNQGREQSPVLVHISDVHFGSRDGKSVHRFDTDPSGLSLAEQLGEEFTGTLGLRYLDPQRLHLIVSGDLVWGGTPAEFSLAHKCLVSVCDRLSIGRERVSFVPGNHDISWHLSKDDPATRFNNYLAFLGRFYGDALMAERYPNISWPIHLSDSPPAASSLVGVVAYPKSKLLIATLNSCVYETHQHHYGFVGEPQMRALRKLLSELRTTDEFVKVAVLHHHLHPYREYLTTDGNDIWTDTSTIRDAGFVETVLERLGFDLVLHGHKHKPQTRETLVRDVGAQKRDARPLIVCGAGTVSCLELEHAHANHYEIIEILQAPRRSNAPFVRVQWRELNLVAGAEWSNTESYEISG